MPPKRRGMRRFFCCGPKDEADADLPVKPAKQVSEKADRSGVTSSGKAKKEEQQQKGEEEKRAIPTSEDEATKDHLPAEKPDAPTTKPEGITEEEQQAETPVPTSGDVVRDHARADAPAALTTAADGKEDLVAAGPAVDTTENAAEKQLAAEVPAASVEKTQESPAEQPTTAEHPEEPAIAVDETVPDIESPVEAFFTPAEEKPEEPELSVDVPAIPEKSESRVKTPVSPTAEDEDSPAEPTADVIPAPAASEPADDHPPTEEPVVVAKEEPGDAAKDEPAVAAEEEPVAAAEEEPVVAAKEEPIVATEEKVVDIAKEEPAIVAKEEPVTVAEEELVVAKEEAVEETSEVQTNVTEEFLPAEISPAVDEALSAEDDAATIQAKEDSTAEPESAAGPVTTTEDNTAAEESIVQSREVVPVDPPVVLTKDEDTHSETHSGTVTDSEDDASSHTTDTPEPGITREDSVIPKGSDQKVSMPRLFPNNRQGNILQRVIESYIINGRSDWKILQKYLPKPTANGDDSAARLTKVIMTRMLENCLSEAELTESRVFLPILREQLAHFYWDDHKDKQAIRLWRKVLGDSANGDSDKFVYRARTNATRSLCNIYFTKALEAHIAGEDPSKHAKKLEEAAGRGADPVTTMWWDAHCSSLMLTAWHQMHDEDSYRALENFRFNAKCAIGKLEARDRSNAESGFLLLAETLMTAADNWGGHVEGDENATRAMSLFLQHHYALGLENDDGDNSSVTKAHTYGACETCDNELSWGHFQTCRYCKVDLCDSCHKSLEETTLRVRVCSPIHDFFRTSGPAPHEIPRDHVLLDGEQVHYKTWIAMLKDEWAL